MKAHAEFETVGVEDVVRLAVYLAARAQDFWVAILLWPRSGAAAGLEQPNVNQVAKFRGQVEQP